MNKVQCMYFSRPQIFFKSVVLVLTVLINCGLGYSEPSPCFMVKSTHLPGLQFDIWCLERHSLVPVCGLFRGRRRARPSGVSAPLPGEISRLLWSHSDLPCFPGQLLLFRLDLDHWGKRSPGLLFLSVDLTPVTSSIFQNRKLKKIIAAVVFYLCQSAVHHETDTRERHK